MADEKQDEAQVPGPNEVPEDSAHEPFEDEDGKPQPGTPEADVPKGTEEPGSPQPGQPSAENTGDNAE